MKKYKYIQLCVLLAFFYNAIQAQKKEPPISDSIKEWLTKSVTEDILNFWATKDPKYDAEKWYIPGGGRYSPITIWGLEDRLNPDISYTPYYFKFKISRTDWGNIYLIEKLSNYLYVDYYESLHPKKLYKRDSIYFNIDSTLFPYDKRYVVFYKPKAPQCCRALNLAGNIGLGIGLLTGKGNPVIVDCMDKARMRLMQFGEVNFVSSLYPTETEEYFRLWASVKEFSSKKIFIKFPKEFPYDWIDITFYTNNKKYWKDSTAEYKGAIYKVHYYLKGDPKDVTEWHPQVTKVTSKEDYEEMKAIGEEFIEQLNYPIKIPEIKGGELPPPER